MSIQTPSVNDLRLTASQTDRIERVFAGVIVAMICAALAAHTAVGVNAPLWLDEAGTGAFASLGSLPDLLSAIRDDSNAPAYYLLIWGWAKLFGTSNIALHVPGLILSFLAPLVAWLGLRTSRPRLAVVWATSVALWGPGIVQSGYARCYPLLLLGVVLSCVSFVRLLDASTRGRAIVWAASGALVMLTHYHGGWLVAVQAVTWLLFKPKDAVRHWPAAFAIAPVIAWMAWHLPRLAPYSSPDATWYGPLTFNGLWYATSVLLGVSPMWLPTAVFLLFFLEFMIHRSHDSRTIKHDIPVAIAGAVALAAAVVFMGVSVLRPLFTARYLVAFAPGVLLLISSRLVIASRGRIQTLAALVGTYGVIACLFWFGPPLFKERAFSFEKASAWVAETQPRRLVYFWDNPTTLAMSKNLLVLIGGYFLRRDGLAVDVRPIVLQPGVDMNDELLAEVNGRTALLWLSDVYVHDTSVRLHPHRIADARSDLECRDFGVEPIGVYACRPRMSP